MQYRPNPLLRLLRRFIISINDNGIRVALANSCRRLFRSLRKNGLVGTFKLAFIQTKPVIAPPELICDELHPFDKEHGTDTSGFISSWKMEAVSLSALHGTAYIGTPSSTLRQALAALPIKHEEFSLVDFGCGKGRVLLVAAEFPFRRIVGVELALDMAQIARANVALNPALKDRITIVNEDALSFELPDGPIVLFLFHPFTATFLRRFLTKLERQFRRNPRPAFLIDTDSYLADDKAVYSDTPGFRATLASFPFLREVSDWVFPISAEEAAVEPSGGTMTRYTVFAVDVTR
jgi:SAM-dependent methyltransferase